MGWEQFIPLAAAVLGGSSSGSSQSTQTKDPWAAAQPWMMSNLGLGQNLQSQYAANPFSQAQQSAYTNAANGNANVRNMVNTIIPQLSNIPAFDRSNPLNKPAPLNLSGAAPGGNSAGSIGFSQPTVQANVPAALQKAYQDYIQAPSNGGGHSNLGMGDTGYGGAAMDFQKFMNTPEGLAAAYMLGKPQNMYLGPQDGSKVPVTDAGIGTDNPNGSLWSGVSGYGADGMGPPSSAMGGNSSNSGMGSGGEGTSAATGGNDGDASGGGDRGTRGGFAKGGMVKKSNLSGPDPKGPDQGKANLQSGEMVIKKTSVDKYGEGFLNAINQGRFDKKARK